MMKLKFKQKYLFFHYPKFKENAATVVKLF